MVSCILTESGVVTGSTASVETNYGRKIEGIVLSLDRTKHLLVMHTNESAIGRPLIRIFNAKHLKSLTVIKTPSEKDILFVNKKNEMMISRNPLPNRAHERVTKTLRDVEPLFMKQSGVSLRGQQAYLQLKRTIDDTRWSGADIRVLGIVLVRDPYGVENVTKDELANGVDDSRVKTTIAQVQKILSKPFTEYKTRHPLDFTMPTATVAAN